MKHIRMATTAEIERIRAGAGLTSESQVVALDNAHGDTDLAVIRRVVELDPVIFSPSSTDRDKYKFVFALEERMTGWGVPEYYFNVKSSDIRWQNVIESWGAENTSPSPEFRYVKGL